MLVGAFCDGAGGRVGTVGNQAPGGGAEQATLVNVGLVRRSSLHAGRGSARCGNGGVEREDFGFEGRAPVGLPSWRAVSGVPPSRRRATR